MILAAKFLLVICFSGFFPFVAHSQTIEQREEFAKGYSLFAAGSYLQAKEFFQRVADTNHALADYSLYYLALIAFNEKNLEGSRQYLSQLRQVYPQSVWSDSADLQRAKIELAEMKYTDAIEALRSLQTDKNRRREIADEALYLQAQAEETRGEISRAYSLYQELRSSSPHSRWTPAARKQVARLREKHPDLFAVYAVTAMAEEADRLVGEREYGEAEITYRRLLNNDLGPMLRLRFLMKLANLYITARKRTDAISVLEEVARDFSKSPEAANALYLIGQILWNRNDNSQALGYFRRVMERYPGSPYIDRSQFAAADIYESLGKKKEAISLYDSLPKNFPRSQVRDDATWRLAWLYYRAGEMGQAYARFKALAGRDSEGKYRSASLYWQARTAEKSGDLDAARRFYQQVVNTDDESYYQALAKGALARMGIAVEEPKTVNMTSGDAEPPVSPEISFHLSRARELSAISLNRLAIGELDEMSRKIGKQPQFTSLLMREYHKNQAYNRSLTLANQLPQSHNERDLFRYPRAYWELIQQKAREKELDPYLIVALIRQESLFDARARSPAVALGLMQLLPSTARRVAKQMGLPPPSNEELFEPTLNLTLGTQYLKDLLQRYSDNWFKAVAAYNAGETAVDRWEKEIVTDDIEEFVERIPYLETRQYVKLVLRNHRIYKRLYDQQG